MSEQVGRIFPTFKGSMSVIAVQRVGAVEEHVSGRKMSFGEICPFCSDYSVLFLVMQTRWKNICSGKRF